MLQIFTLLSKMFAVCLHSLISQQEYSGMLQIFALCSHSLISLQEYSDMFRTIAVCSETFLLSVLTL